MPLSAFAWCIAAMSLPPSLVPGCSISTWLGQVGLMDLEGLYTTKGPWVASESLSTVLYHIHGLGLMSSYIR